MSRIVFYIGCVLTAVFSLQGSNAKSTSTCDAQQVQMYWTTSIALNKLDAMGKQKLPTFFGNGQTKKCWGYLNYYNPKSPFPTTSLTSSSKNFLGSKFLQQTYKVFLPFYLAADDILKDTNFPDKKPRALIQDIDLELRKLIVCIRSKPNFQTYNPGIRYNITLHKKDVKKCLSKDGVTPTPKKVQLVQYKGIMEELYYALTQMNMIVSIIASG